MSEQRVTYSNGCALDDVVCEFKVIGGEHHDGRAIFEVAQLLPLNECCVAWDFGSAAVFEIERGGKKLKTDARHQNSGNRDQRQIRARVGKLQWQDRALIPAEELLDSLQRDGIDVPGISRNVSHATDSGVAGRVKAVVHASAKTQSDELPSAVSCHESVVAEEVLQAVG